MEDVGGSVCLRIKIILISLLFINSGQLAIAWNGLVNGLVFFGLFNRKGTLKSRKYCLNYELLNNCSGCELDVSKAIHLASVARRQTL